MTVLGSVRFLLVPLCLFPLIGFTEGCISSPYRAHPQFESRVAKIEALTLVPPAVEVYELFPSGLSELRDDWSALGRKNLEEALVEKFGKKLYSLRTLRADSEVSRTDSELRKELEEIKALYTQVNKSVQLHSYGPQVFPEKVTHFEYGMGSVQRVVEAHGTDSLIFVTGFDQVSAQDPKTYVSIAVTDSWGTILWYCVKGSKGGYALKDPFSTAMLVEEILSSFPKRAE
jgi:hypothetical protein